MKKKAFLVFSLLVVLAAMTSLTRCGSGVGRAYDASVNGSKF